MTWFRYKGVTVEADSPEEAKSKVMAHMPEQGDPTAGMSTFEKLAAGAGSGMANVGRQVGNILGMVSDEDIEAAAQLDKPLTETTPGAIGRFVGETAALAPVGMGATGAAAKVLGRALPAAASRVLPMAAGGAAEGAVLGGPGERGTGAAMGGALGGGIGAGAAALGRVARPTRPIPEAQRLLDQGVDLTPGQARPGGLMDVIEQSASGRLFPYAQSARAAAGEDVFRRAVRQSVPQGKASEVVGRNANELIASAEKVFDEGYDALRALPARVPDSFLNELVEDLGNARGVPELLNSEAQWLARQFQRGVRSTDDLLDLRSMVRRRMREYARNPDVNSDDMRRALRLVETELSGRLEQVMGPAQRRALKSLDRAYSRFKVVEDAAVRSTDAPYPTPHQFSMAVKQQTPSKGQYARGGGHFRDLAEAQAATIGKMNTPPTGMALAVPAASAGAGMLLGGPGGAALGAAAPSLVAGFGSGTRAGRNVLLGRTLAQRGMQRAGQPARRALPYARTAYQAYRNEE
jgi:hypothetical protein